MILITGANGHLGNLTIDFLLTNTPAANIAALVRDEQKGEALKKKGIDIRIGDYTNIGSLKKAFIGIDTLFLISSGSLQNRYEQHANAIEAAKEAGVKHIVYSSALGTSLHSKFTAGIDHYKTEELLKATGIPYTSLRNTFYFEVLPMLLGDSLQSGNWYYPSAGAGVNFASRVDMAEAAANVLLDPAIHENKTYEITSTRPYTLPEIAAILSKYADKQIVYTDIPLTALKEGMEKASVPADYIPMLVSIADAIAADEFNVTDPSLENILKHQPLELETFIAGFIQSTKKQ